MERQHILKADFLDILFEHRNKNYGAYELRSNYSRRLRKALSVTVLIIIVVVAIPFIASLKANANGDLKPPPIICTLSTIEPAPKPILPKPNNTKPIKSSGPVKDLNSKIFTSPTIDVAQNINDDDKLPSKPDMDKHIAGTINTDDGSDSNPDLGGPSKLPDDGNHGSTLVDDKEDTKLHNVFDGGIEIYPEFPGGEEAMVRFISSHIKYPSKALENEIQGKVVLGFTVDKKGAITDIHLVRGIGFGCDEEAQRVMKMMPKWKPAQMNGKSVNVMYQIPIEYSLEN